MEVTIEHSVLENAATTGIDGFLQAFVDATYKAIGGELDAEGMALLNADQITLLAYHILRDEVMDGGFVQLIHNGYGPFIFRNPFDKAIKGWGIHDLYKLISKCRKLYTKHAAVIEEECSDEAFMALFERYPEFDDFDDEFVENEERWTDEIAHYVDEHIDRFAKIV